MNHASNRRFEPLSPLLRSIFAVGALFATVITMGSIAALAEHYGAIAQSAPVAAVVVAQR